MRDIKSMYKERVEIFKTTSELKVPRRVPVLGNIETYALAYSNTKLVDALNNHDIELKAYEKPYQDIYVDGAMIIGNNKAFKFYDVLGNNAHFISSDGMTMQHKELVFMSDGEYELLINNPEDYIDNVFLKRKYSAFAQGYENAKETIKNAVPEMFSQWEKLGKGSEIMKNKYGIPVVADSIIFAQLDVLLDFIRGFIPLTMDLRRNPCLVKEACEAITDMVYRAGVGDNETFDDFPWCFTPLHMPTFLSPKQFGDLYWPSYKKILLKMHKKGKKVYAFLEGDWGKFYEFLQELPKGLLIGGFEKDDVIEAKKKVGDTVVISGGMKLDILKYSSKQECIDYAKRLIDECAPGGGYIFTTNMALITGSDINVENLIAVNEYVRDNAFY